MRLRKYFAAACVILGLAIPAVAASANPVSPQGEERRAIPEYTGKTFERNGRLIADTPAGRLNAQSSLEDMTKFAPRPQSSPLGNLYTTSWDTSGYGSIVGSARYKNENTQWGQAPGTACGGPIYHTQWIDMAAAGWTWVEIGTAHWCDGSKTWFGFAAENFDPAYPTGHPSGKGGWWIFNTAQTSTSTHLMRIEQSTVSLGWWHLYIDSSYMGSATFGTNYIGAYAAKLGLESYTNWATFDGTGAVVNEISARWWNGQPGGYWWAPVNLNYAIDDTQMYHRHIAYPNTPNTFNGVAQCQNVAAVNCG